MGLLDGGRQVHGVYAVLGQLATLAELGGLGALSRRGIYVDGPVYVLNDGIGWGLDVFYRVLRELPVVH